MIHTDDPGPVSRQKRRILNPFRALSVSPRLSFHLSHLRFSVSIPLLLAFSLTSFSCRKESPPEPPPPATLSLRVEDASCTEAWLKATTTELPATVRLLRDGQRVSVLRLLASDSLLFDEGLLPRRTYTYQLQKLTNDSSVVETSASVQVTTMDTTSHNFTWQIDTLGDGGGSVLLDVAIINDTLAYAVGAIYKRDSLGNWDPNAYNMVKWNGQRWELMRIQFYTFCGQSGTGSYPAKAIFAFSAQDIWVAMDGSQVVRWNGQSQSQPMCTPVSVNKLWGDNPNSIYAVGYGGGIAHYANGTWRRIESGTRLPIMDIYGAQDPRTGKYQILCVSADPNIPGRSQVLAIENMAVREMATDPMWEPWAIWFIPNRLYMHAGDGLWQAPALSGPWVRNGYVPPWFKASIGGQGLNDIVVCGSFWFLVHWNGVRWQVFFPRTTSGALGGVQIKGNLLVAVGFIDNRAAVVVGRR